MEYRGPIVSLPEKRGQVLDDALLIERGLYRAEIHPDKVEEILIREPDERLAPGEHLVGVHTHLPAPPEKSVMDPESSSHRTIEYS